MFLIYIFILGYLSWLITRPGTVFPKYLHDTYPYISVCSNPWQIDCSFQTIGVTVVSNIKFNINVYYIHVITYFLSLSLFLPLCSLHATHHRPPLTGPQREPQGPGVFQKRPWPWWRRPTLWGSDFFWAELLLFRICPQLSMSCPCRDDSHGLPHSLYRFGVGGLMYNQGGLLAFHT